MGRPGSNTGTVSETEVRLAADLRFCLVCACCLRLHVALRQGAKVCGVSVQECGSPAVNQWFPMYRGPLTDSEIERICFRCGNRAEHAVRPLLASGSHAPEGVGICRVCFPVVQAQAKRFLAGRGVLWESSNGR